MLQINRCMSVFITHTISFAADREQFRKAFNWCFDNLTGNWSFESLLMVEVNHAWDHNRFVLVTDSSRDATLFKLFWDGQ